TPYEASQVLGSLLSLSRLSSGQEAHMVTVFPRGPVELGEPNVLICFVDKFFPPTDFYPRQDNSFRKFSYLPFLPSPGDFYDCRVEHWGLPEPFTKHWAGPSGCPHNPCWAWEGGAYPG
uniref:Immunoglobulin C1-set domain-containing protein n=1 Tax=Terrapene triunguis TaxID=2587831 RepID=A0A674JG53_9SAUR